MKEVQDDRLEVEEVRIAREAVDPGDPHEEGVLQGVHEAKDNHDLALDILKEETIVKAESKDLQIHVQ